MCMLKTLEVSLNGYLEELQEFMVLDLMRYNYRMELLLEVMLTVSEADLELIMRKQRVQTTMTVL